MIYKCRDENQNLECDIEADYPSEAAQKFAEKYDDDHDDGGNPFVEEIAGAVEVFIEEKWIQYHVFVVTSYTYITNSNSELDDKIDEQKF